MIRKHFFFPILCLIILFGLFSGFSVNNQNNSLTLYLKSWGILRYRMPTNNNECNQLDRAAYYGIESILANNSKRNTNREINKLVQACLKFVSPNEGTSDSADYKSAQILYLQRTWLENPSLAGKNRSSLVKILNSKPTTIPFNTNIPSNGKPLELTYCLQDIDEESIEARIFGIGLLWNAVDYFFPFKGNIVPDWDTILSKFIGKTINCDTEISYQQIVMELVELLNDGHASVNSYELMNYWGFFSLPIQVEVSSLDSFPIVTKIWMSNGAETLFELGDKIVSINGISYRDFFSINERYFSGGNSQVKIDKLCSTYVRTETNKELSVSIQRGSKIIKWEEVPISSAIKNQLACFSIYCDEAVKLYGDSIGYLNLSLIEPSEFREYYNLVAHLGATIIDLRSYPTNILDTIANYYFDKPTIISSWTSPDYQFPGLFTSPQNEILGKENNSHYKGMIVLLVNNMTSSRGEYIALALQALPNTVTVGTQTSGTDGDILKIDLPNRLRGMFTTVSICYPNGNSTFGKGIEIDFELSNSCRYNTKYDAFIDYSLRIIKKLWGQPSHPHGAISNK